MKFATGIAKYIIVYISQDLKGSVWQKGKKMAPSIELTILKD